MSVFNEINLKVNVSLGDGSFQEQNEEDSFLTLFILWGVILPLIAIAGLVGNILTIIVLWRREMHSTTILYLRGLVITDTGILIGSVITLTPISCANYLKIDALEYFRDSVYPLIHAPGYYIIMTLQQCNVWITVSVSMERYIAICHPFRAARLITRRKTINVLISIVFISLVYNVPHLFASRGSPCDAALTTALPLEVKATVVNLDGDFYGVHLSSTQSTPSTSLFMTSTTSAVRSDCLTVATTEFGATEFYKTYRSIMYSIIIYVIPFLALLILNSFLIKELMTMQQRRSGTNIHDENEANLSMVLVLIVIVFIFCQTPGLISQFDLNNHGVFIHWLAVSNFLFTTNSAVNFLIYTAFGRKFRRVLLRVFRHIFRKHRRQSQSSCRTYTNGDVETFEPPTTSCTSLRLCSCYRKETKSNGHASENIPLNTMTDKTTPNGSIQNVKCNNGTTQIRYKTAEEVNDKEASVSTGTAETMSLVPPKKHLVILYTEAGKNFQPSSRGVSVRDEDNSTRVYSNYEQTANTDPSNVNANERLFENTAPAEYRRESVNCLNDNGSVKISKC